LFAFKLLVALAETGTEGSVRPAVSRSDEPKLYQKLVETSAKLLAGKSRNQKLDKEFVRQHTISDSMMDRRFLHDVELEVKIQAEAAAVAKANKKKPKLDADEAAQERDAEDIGNEEENEDEEEEDDDQELQVQVDLSWIENFEALGDSKEGNLQFNGHDEDAFKSFLETSRQAWITRNLPSERQKKASKRPRSVASKKNEAAEALAREEARLNVEHVPFDGPVMVPKLQMTMTPIPIEGETDCSDDPLKVAGIYVRFINRDKELNPGKFWRHVLNNRIHRVQRNIGSMRGRNTEEMFPAYSRLFNTKHPVGNFADDQMYFLAAIGYRPELLDEGNRRQEVFNSMEYTNRHDKFYLAELFSTARALQEMRDAKCNPSFCNEVDGPLLWYNRQTKRCTFPEDLDTYKYHQRQVFWCHPENIGLSEQYFPHVNLDRDFLTCLLAGQNTDKFLQDQQEQGVQDEQAERNLNNAFEEIRNLLRDNFIVTRTQLQATNLVSYDTNNEFVHRHAEATIINDRVMRELPSHYGKTMDDVQALQGVYVKNWRDVVFLKDVETWCDHLEGGYEDGKTLRDRIRECEKFSKLRNMTQEACLSQFASLWSLEGDVEGMTNIPETIRSMLKWYRDNQAKLFPNVTRQYTLWDPEMGFFGNSMLRTLKHYSCIARALQPLVCIIAEGLFSCYHFSPNALAFNLMLHGRYDVGKTFLAITTLLKYTTIDKTVEEYCVQTSASDTTLKHNYDLIVASDEVMPWKVNAKEAEKKPQEVNKEKIKMTRRQIGLKAFTYEKGPNGESLRWTRTVTTDHYVSLVEVTNNVVEAMNALASRYHCMTIAQPKVPSRELDGFMGASLSSDTKTHLRLNQFLSACAYKAIMCGAIREPDIQLFNDLSNRVIDYLVKKKSITQENGNRALEKMQPYVRQLVIRMAIHHTFDLPCGPCFMKPFKAEDIRQIQPYLYSTVEITWWVWTAMASAWIDEHNADVIRAACLAAGVDWHDEESCYTHYENDVEGKIPWQTLPNDKWEPNQGKENERLVNLHYICLQGTWPQILKQISLKSKCGLAPNDVESVLNRMRDMHFTLPRDGYMPQPRGEMKEKHRKKYVGIDAVTGEKKYDKPSYKSGEDTIPYSVDDIPKIGKGTTMPAIDFVDLHQTQNRKFYFMPNIATFFLNKTIVEALMYASMCDTFPAGKILLGIPSDHDLTQMQIFNAPASFIQESVREMDRQAKFDRWNEEEEKWEWTGQGDFKPIPRSEGIAFNRRGGISTKDSVFFTGKKQKNFFFLNFF
jgi:hypothetical protein